MGTPRIADEDRLIIEDLLSGDLEGEWVRVSAYAQGHRVSANGALAYCGTILAYDEYWWELVQRWATRWSHYENRAKGSGKWSPTPHYIARDQRDAKSRCSVCKRGKDLGLDDREDVITDREDPVSSAYDERPFVDPTPAERLQRQRFMTKVAYVARELGAEIE